MSHIVVALPRREACISRKKHYKRVQAARAREYRENNGRFFIVRLIVQLFRRLITRGSRGIVHKYPDDDDHDTREGPSNIASSLTS